MASDFRIRHAAHIVRQGGIIAYPTDTIYGLGCDPYNPQALDRLNTIKQRPADKYFILLAAHTEQIEPLLALDDKQKKTVCQNKVPTSWIVAASANTPGWLTDRDNNITIRITDNKDVQRLCGTLGHAIISTSANISGKAPARNALDLHRYFHHTADMILVADRTPTGRASKIIRLCDNHVIRP